MRTAAERLRDRVRLARAAGAELPDLSDEALGETLEDWLLPWLGGVRTAVEAERAWTRFDSYFQAQTTWSRLAQTNTPKETQTSLNPVLLKPLPTGGVVGVGFNGAYTNTDGKFFGRSIPWTNISQTNFIFEQPLLQGFGVEINELRANQPGSILYPFPTSGSGTGILVAAAAADASKAQYEFQLQQTLFAVEQAYWNLYTAYWNLYTADFVVRQTLDSWRIGKARFDAKQMTIQDLSQIEQQYHQFRAARLAALGNGPPGQAGVLRAELQLRQAMGAPMEDGDRLVPADAPVVTGFAPDWAAAVREALAERPDLTQARTQLRQAELQARAAADLALADVRFISQTGITGLNDQLGNRGQANWTIGFQTQYPLGTRDARAQLREATLQRAQQQATVRDLEEQIVFALQDAYRQLFESYKSIEILRASRKAAEIQMKARAAEFANSEGIVFLLLNAQETYASALFAEQSAVAAYNVALANYQLQKGALLEYHRVVVWKDKLPTWLAAAVTDRVNSRPAGTPPTGVKSALELFEQLPPLPAGPVPDQDRPTEGGQPSEKLPSPRPVPTPAQRIPQRSPAALLGSDRPRQ